jgi:hypothetical protein
MPHTHTYTHLFPSVTRRVELSFHTMAPRNLPAVCRVLGCYLLRAFAMCVRSRPSACSIDPITENRTGSVRPLPRRHWLPACLTSLPLSSSLRSLLVMTLPTCLLALVYPCKRPTSRENKIANERKDYPTAHRSVTIFSQHSLHRGLITSIDQVQSELDLR